MAQHPTQAPARAAAVCEDLTAGWGASVALTLERGNTLQRLSDEQHEAIFRARHLRGVASPGYLSKIGRYRALRIGLPALSHALWGRQDDAVRGARYLFATPRYHSLLEELPRNQVALLGMRKSHVRYAEANGIPCRTVFSERAALARNLPTPRAPAALDQTFDELVRALRGDEGRFLIVKTDVNPINRLLVFAAREAGLRSVCLQHGVFSRTSHSFVYDGWHADYTLVYDSHQRAILEDVGFASSRLPILGFHASPVTRRFPDPDPGRTRRVCFFGQAFGWDAPERRQRYREVVRAALTQLAAAGVEVAFKPHPRERSKPDVGEFASLFEGSMADAFEQFEVCVSISSTSLIEATLAGRVAIQLYDELFRGGRFDEAPYAHLVHADRLDELPARCLEAAPVANPELELMSPEQVRDRFVEVLDGLAPNPPPHPSHEEA